LVAGADAERAQDQRQRVEAVAHTDAVADFAPVRELGLERLDLRTEDVAAALHDALCGSVALSLEFRVRGPEVQERNWHSAGSSGTRSSRDRTGSVWFRRRP